MNWKLFVGSTIGKADKLLTGSNLSFIKNSYPYGRHVIFDLVRQFPEAKVIFDIGACIGTVSLNLHKNFPDATIYSFEPIEETFKQLQENTRHISTIKRFKYAAGDTNNTLTIPIYAEATINTLKKADYNDAPIASEVISVVRLDDFVDKNSISEIDILKIDVEGFEFEVLNGLGDFLQKVKCIVVEVGYIRSTTKTHFSEMESFMEDNGFYLSNIYQLQHAYNDKTRLGYSDNVYFNGKMNK